MDFLLDHLGIAVRSLAAAKSIYEKLIAGEEPLCAGVDQGYGVGGVSGCTQQAHRPAAQVDRVSVLDPSMHAVLD
jgi:hypothetical protein